MLILNTQKASRIRVQYSTSVNYAYACPLKATAREGVVPCSCDHINLTAGNGYLGSITPLATICVKRQKLSLNSRCQFKIKDILCHSEDGQICNVFVLEKNPNIFHRGKTIYEVTEHRAPCGQAGFTHYLQLPTAPFASCINNFEQFYLTVKNVHCDIWRELLLLHLTASVTAQDPVLFLTQLTTETASWERLC